MRMLDSAVLPENELFSCHHLGESANDEQDIMNFTTKHVTGQGFINYLRYYAFPDEEAGNMRTYVIRDKRSGEFVAYFSLKAGLISLNEEIQDDNVRFETLPGVEIANFAIDYRYTQKHEKLKGIGKVIFTDFMVPIKERTAASIGIRIIYIFALPVPELIGRYKEYGFARLDAKSEEALHRRFKPRCDKSCIFMYQQL
ncbi:MAG: hypothetical protein II842_00675 [Butyrivibrio sp.]|nr:hypothetical protein [Butyrivibrio sp.]